MATSMVLRLLTFCLALLCGMGIILPVLAVVGYAPKTYENNLIYGEGVYFAPYEVKIYEQPDETSPLLESFRWTRSDASPKFLSKVNNGVFGPEQVFLSFYPTLNVAMMAVVSENGEGWAEVVYDQFRKKTGWVKILSPEASASLEEGVPRHFEKFQTWQDFMRYNARVAGTYWLNGVSQYNRSLRTAPQDDAKIIPVTVIRNMKVKHVRGNWMLVEILDFENKTPIGWMRWRDDDGRLMMFTNFSGLKQPVLSSL